MRDEGVKRFADYKSVSIEDPYYLVYKPLFRDLIEMVDKYAKGRVLDIGCGNKPYEEMFHGKVSEYVGCDIVQSSLKKVDILCEATNIPLPSESFDTVFSTQTIEHVADHQQMINEAFRLLNRGGHIIISGPMYWHLHEEPYDYFRFTKYGFKHVLEKSGFEVVELCSNGGKWALCGQVIIHTLYPDIHDFKTFGSRLFRKVLNKMGGVAFINKVFNSLDNKRYNEINTTNYVVVGKK